MSSTSINVNKQIPSPPSSQSKIGSTTDLRQKVLLGQVRREDERKQSLFYINQNQEAQQGIVEHSSRQIQLDPMVLGMNSLSKDMYGKKSWNHFDDFYNSEGIALSVVEDIISKGSDILYNNYLQEKSYKHVFNSIMYLSELSWQQERLVHDLDFDLKKQKHYFNHPPEDFLVKYEDNISEDQEPDPPGRENRRNFNVEIEKKLIEVEPLDDSIARARKEVIDKLLEQSSPQKKRKKRRDRSNKSRESLQNLSKDQLQLSKNNSVYSSRQSSPHQTHSMFQSVKEVESMQVAEEEIIDREAQIIESYNNPVFEKHLVKFVNLTQIQEIDRVEEQLRLLKEREIELKQQKAEFEALRQLEQKDQQLRLKNAQKGDSDKKQIAYDYNGQVIGMQPLKVDKFPNSTVVIGHSVTKGETTAIDYSAQSKVLQKQLKKKQKQQQDDDASSVDQLSNNQQTPSGRLNSLRSKDSIQVTAKVVTKSIPTQNVANVFNKNIKDPYSLQAKDIVFFQQQDIYDAFKANKGVTIIEGGRVKKGPNFTTITKSVDLSKMIERDYGKNIQITKNDYNKLVGGLNTSIDSELGANMSRVSSHHSVQSQSAANIRLKTEQLEMKLPLNLLTNSSGVTPQSVSFTKKNKKSGQNIFSISSNNNLNEIFDQNQSQSLGHNQSVNDLSRNQLSTMSRKKNFFSSQKKLQPIDPSKISIQSMEILQTLALDDHDYVLKVLNQNPAESKRMQVQGDSYSQNRSITNQKLDISSQSGGQDQQSQRSILNDVSVNRSNNNQSINSSINNMSGISPQQINNISNKHLQLKQFTQKNRIAPLQRPTDEYNRAIITGSIDWGNPIVDSSRSNTSATPNIKVDDNFKQKHTLGSHGKFPRDRLMKKTLNEMQHNHLSPPEIGSTMGYGAGNGFHPDKLVTVKQFIQELNQSNGNIQQNNKSQIRYKQNS